MLQLKENSITAELYRWFYAKKGMPTNLCPYFWKVVIMYTFILPYTLFCLPVIVVKPFKRFQKDIDTNRILTSLLIYILTLFTSAMVYVIAFLCGVKKIEPLFNFGVVGWVLVVSIAIGAFFGHLKNKWDNMSESDFDEKQKTPKIFLIKEFISAKYHKYCPQITWKK